MNINVWNIKEMLSTPTAIGTSKFSLRSSIPSDYSNLSDSQLLFSSQFCPENMQSVATPLELGMQLGQHNSQDSEPSIFAKYQTKPLLFDEDTKERGSLNFGVGRVKNILENFEACKNKIKDKYDREVLSTFISSINDKLQGLQACLDKFGEMFYSRNQSILVQLESISQTLQDALQSHCGSVLKALTDKSQMEQALLEMERRLAAKDVEILDVKSSVQLLRESLESLSALLNDQHLKLCEEFGFLKLPNTLAELHTFISSTRLPAHMADNSSQTSPGPYQDCLPEKKNARCLSCRGSGVCWTSGQSQPHCVTMGEQHGASPGCGTCTDDLNTAAGGKANSIATEACCRGVKYCLRTQSSAKQPCMCCANSCFLGDSQDKPCSVSQAGPPSTPWRKAFRRGTRGLQPMTPLPQRQPQVCHLSSRKDTPGSTAWATDSEVEVGKKAKQKPGRIPWNKAKEKKKKCPTKMKEKLSRCADGGPKQRKTNRITEVENSRKKCYSRYRVALDLESSDTVFAVSNQPILSSTQIRITNNFPSVPCSTKSLQKLADKRKTSLEMGSANVSSVKRNFWDSSPQDNVFSLCSTIGEKQMSCFSLCSPTASKKPYPVSVLAQQNIACYSLVFDSDYSD